MSMGLSQNQVLIKSSGNIMIYIYKIHAHNIYIYIILDILHHFRAEVILGAYFEPDQIRRATGLAVVLLPFCMLCATRAVMQSQRKAVISAVWQAPQKVEKQNPTKLVVTHYLFGGNYIPHKRGYADGLKSIRYHPIGCDLSAWF